jgi:hypothetical protein
LTDIGEREKRKEALNYKQISIAFHPVVAIRLFIGIEWISQCHALWPMSYKLAGRDYLSNTLTKFSMMSKCDFTWWMDD